MTMRKNPSRTKLYVWHAANHKEGCIGAPSKNVAKLLLQQRGLHIKKLSQQPHKKIKPKDITLFIRQLALLLTSGIPLLQGLETLKTSYASSPLNSLIDHLITNIQKGYSFAQTLREHPQYFNTLDCSLIDAGEQAGILASLLLKVAHYREQTYLMQKKLKTILTYPFILLSVSVVTSLIILLWVIPKFVNLFNQFGAELPKLTQWFIQFAFHIRDYGLYYFIFFFIMGWGIYYAFKKYSPVQAWVDHVILKIPILKQLFEQSITAHFCYTLSLTLHSGITFLEALKLTLPVANNSLFIKAILKIHDQVREGLPFTHALQTSQRFSPLVTQMIAIGEESGKLESMLNQIAKQQEEMFFDLVFNCSRLLEPAFMILLGLFIGILITAMYLPIFQLGAVI